MRSPSICARARSRRRPERTIGPSAASPTDRICPMFSQIGLPSTSPSRRRSPDTSATPEPIARRRPDGTSRPLGSVTEPRSGRRIPHTSSSTSWCPAPATPARPTISPGETRRLKSCSRPPALTLRISSFPASAPTSSASATCSASAASGVSAASFSASSGGLPSIAGTIAGTVRPSRGSAAIVTSPSRRTVTSSRSAITSSRMWETNTTPTSRSRRTRRISSSVSVLAAPSAEVGSSRMRMRGSVSSALPISTSWRWARLSSATGVRRSASRPSSSTTGRARAAISARLTNGPRRGSRSVNRFASTSRSGKTLSSCDTTATPWRTASAVEAKLTSSSSRRTVPASGLSAPATIFTSVDLPAPFSPRRACTEPARTVKSAPASATTPPYVLRTPRASSTHLPRGLAQVLVRVVELLLDLVLEVGIAAGGVLLGRDDLVDVVLVDGQRAGVPDALRQVLAVLLGLSHERDGEVALQPVLGADQRGHVAVADALERHRVEVAGADDELLALVAALDAGQRDRGLAARADVGEGVGVRLHLRAPGVEVVRRALLGVEDEEGHAGALLLDHVLEALVALLEDGQAGRVGAHQDLALGALGELREDGLGEVGADLLVRVADQELHGLLRALRRRDVDGHQRYVLRARGQQWPEEQVGGQRHHRHAVLRRARGGLEELHLLRPVDLGGRGLRELHAGGRVGGRLGPQRHLLREVRRRGRIDERELGLLAASAASATA